MLKVYSVTKGFWNKSGGSLLLGSFLAISSCNTKHPSFFFFGGGAQVDFTSKSSPARHVLFCCQGWRSEDRNEDRNPEPEL